MPHKRSNSKRKERKERFEILKKLYENMFYDRENCDAVYIGCEDILFKSGEVILQPRYVNPLFLKIKEGREK